MTNLDELGKSIRERLEKIEVIEAAIDEELAEALASFPLRGQSMTAALRNQREAWLQWIASSWLPIGSLRLRA